MNCEQAQKLFDGYLDGELSPALTTELGAHRLQCPECRRALALMEVSGHILATDQEPKNVPVDFTDRLLACMGPARKGWVRGAQRVLYVGVPVAAAAVVALALLGVFDRAPGQTAGEKVPAPLGEFREAERTPPQEGRSLDGEAPASEAERRFSQWLISTQKNIEAKEKSGRSLQNMMDMTILQIIDVLQQADDAAKRSEQPNRPASLPPAPPTEPQTAGQDDVEDL